MARVQLRVVDGDVFFGEVAVQGVWSCGDGGGGWCGDAGVGRWADGVRVGFCAAVGVFEDAW